MHHVSYSQLWFHRASSASRLHTATCWCTCGNGRCLSTCSRTPCAARISTPPSPLVFYFSSEKERRQTTSTRETDERASTIHHSIRNRFPLFVFNDGVRHRCRETDTGPLSDHSPFSCCHTHSWTLLRLPKRLRGNGESEFNLWSIHAFCIWVMKVSSWRSTKDLAVLKQWLNIKQKYLQYGFYWNCK